MARFGYQSGDYPLDRPTPTITSSSKGSSAAAAAAAAGFDAGNSSQLLLDRSAAAFLPPKTPIPLRPLPKS